MRKRSGGSAAWTLAAVVCACVAPSVALAGGSVYVASDTTSLVSQFGIALGGPLVPLTPATATADLSPAALVVSPDGGSVYVANFYDVSQFSVDPLTGELAPKSPATVANGTGSAQSPPGADSQGIAVSPNGRSLYVTNSNLGTVSQYSIDPTTGDLSPNTPAMVATGGNPSGVAVAPNGASVYVVNLSGNTISQFDVDPTTGNLTPKTPATVIADAGPSTGPRDIAITPNGRSAYVTNEVGNGDVLEYDIDPVTGDLSPKAQPTVASGANPGGIIVSPSGHNAYVAAGTSGNGAVSQYRIDPVTGELSPLTPATVPAGAYADGIAASADGADVFVANLADGTVSQYAVDPSSGALSPLAPAAVPAGTRPYAIATTPLPSAPVVTTTTTTTTSSSTPTVTSTATVTSSATVTSTATVTSSATVTSTATVTNSATVTSTTTVTTTRTQTSATTLTTTVTVTRTEPAHPHVSRPRRRASDRRVNRRARHAVRVSHRAIRR